MIHALTLVGSGFREAFLMFWETLWALVLGFGLSGAVQAFVSRSEMQKALGGQGVKSLARATVFGMISSSCSYAASAMAKSLFQKGATFTAAMVFMFASTNLVVELGLVLWVLIGWQFTASEFVGGLIMIILFSMLSRFFFTPLVLAAARKRLNSGDDTMPDHAGHTAMETGDAPLQQEPLRVRLRSAAGWADAASYTMADLTMLRKEMVIGYLVAGFLAVLVPNALWNRIFISGHGFWTSLENVVVGPLIAIISFVCSIGNVPLAAALWQGGISFGGAVSFIFADLITLPLILIYRKYYGGRLTLRLVALAWFVMSAAGLIVEYLFLALGLVPAHGRIQIVQAGIQWNYTSILNILFLVVFAAIVWLSRNQARFGGGKGYAIDPVCGMQVQTDHAPAQATHAGHHYYFCSDHCKERFVANPDRFTSPGAAPHRTAESPTGTAIDPICGMSVDPAHAATTRARAGETFYFCGIGCAEAFDRQAGVPTGTVPLTVAVHSPTRSASKTATDPVCGMTVDVATGTLTSVHDGNTYDFCSPGCKESFDTEPTRYVPETPPRIPVERTAQ